MTFEEKKKKLDEIIKNMESGELPIDEMIGKFEEGRKLVDECRRELDAISLKIEKVTAGGEVEEMKFSGDAPADGAAGVKD